MSGDTSPNMESTAAHTEVKEFDIDKALNTKGFAEFLAAHPDAEAFDMEDGAKVKERFELFEAKAAVSKGLKELYSGHIEKEMGITLVGKDLLSIDAHIESQAIQNPEEVIKMKDRLDSFRELPKQIHELEKQLAQLGKVGDLSAKLESLHEDKANLETAKKHLGFIGKAKLTYQAIALYAKATPMLLELIPGVKFSDEYAQEVEEEMGSLVGQWDALKAVKEKHGKIGKKEAGNIQANIGNQIASVENALAIIQQVEKLKAVSQEMFGNIRKELLSGVSDIEELTIAIKAKVSAQFQEMTRNGSIKSLDQAQERFESLKSVAESTETRVNPLGDIDEEDFQERVDASLEKAASEEIIQTVRRANMGTNAFTKLEKALEPFLEREKIGSKEGDEARDFISGALEDVAAHLGNTNEDKAKKLMVARILIKMKS